MADNTAGLEEDVEINLDEPTGAEFGHDEIGQVRNLLLGSHARATLERLERVEQELIAAIDEATSSIGRRLDDLEGRLDEESKARRGGQIDLRSDFERRSAEIRHQIGSKSMELTEKIENVDATLRERHVDRYTLAGLFEQAAADLNSDQ